MSSSQSKIEDLLNRWKTTPPDQNNSMESRPSNGQNHRPMLLSDNSPTQRRIQRPGELVFSPKRTDPTETDEKLKEIMKISGNLTIDGVAYQTDIKDMEDLGELGNGTCGQVVKMRHKPSGAVIAVKQMRRSGCSEENKRIIMDIEVVLQSHDCPFIVCCLGCFITESEVWICMELMSTCFDKLLKRLKKSIPENVLGKVTVATVSALSYLKETHGVIHRDVKPSNILLDERGNVKLCDFGISGRLVDSMAKTKGAGCAAYMAPERIEPDPKNPDYDVRADVWSLGITLVELATGKLPYQDCESDFEVLSCVVAQDPPTLPEDMEFSCEFRKFVACCLTKDRRQRPKYTTLREHQFLKSYEKASVNVGEWFSLAVKQAELIVANNAASRYAPTPPSPSTTRRHILTQHRPFVPPPPPTPETHHQNPPSCTNGSYIPVSATAAAAATDHHPPNAGLPPDGRTFHNSRLASFHHNSTNHQRELPYQRSSLHQSNDRSRSSLSPPETTGRFSPGPEKIRQPCYSPHYQRQTSSPHPPSCHILDTGGNYSPYAQRRFTADPTPAPPHAPNPMSPYQQRRHMMGDGWWHSPVGSPLPLRTHLPNATEQPYNCGNTSPIVLQRFYHQQKQHQAAKEAETDAGKKRFASCIKLQLGGSGDRSGRSSRHQSPEPPPRLNRAVSSGDSSNNPSPLAVRRNIVENSSASPSLSRRHVSPSPPVPPPRRLSESNSVPGSPQHVRARFHYTPELQRRFYRNNNDVS